jgi:hypothetical protein
MEIALGVMEMSPDDFWGMTMGEFAAKFDGWQERNGGKGKSKPPPMTKSELDALREYYPDGGSIKPLKQDTQP